MRKLAKICIDLTNISSHQKPVPGKININPPGHCEKAGEWPRAGKGSSWGGVERLNSSHIIMWAFQVNCLNFLEQDLCLEDSNSSLSVLFLS